MKHILLCDDNQDILEVTREILRTHGYSVTILDACINIQSEAERLLPDLILMDLWMPGKSGEDAIRDLKKAATTKHIPVLIFSAVHDADKAAKRCGADGVIIKPYDIGNLTDTVKRYLSQASASH